VSRHSQAAIYVALLRQFARADSARAFSFSSGVVGAVPMGDAALVELLQASSQARAASLLREAVRFIFAAVVPARTVALWSRAALRRLRCGASSVHPVTVVSVGAGPAAADPYFGAFLATTATPFNYLKIVGGRGTKASGFTYVEAALPAAALLWLAAVALLHPFLVLWRLANGLRAIERGPARCLYFLLGMRETTSGAALQNLINAEALRAHMASGVPRTVYYPMEGRTWEKRLVASARASKVRACGYLHCALTPRHVSLLHGGFFRSEEMPHVARAPGILAAQALAATLVETEVRPTYFIRAEPIRHLGRAPETLLFALTGHVEESGRILHALAELESRRMHRLVVRLNPNTASYEALRALAGRLGLTLYGHAQPALPGFCFFRSSSVAIAYLRADVVPVYLDLGEAVSNNSFELDPSSEFESVRVDAGFADAVCALAARSPVVVGGAELANRYLDQRYDPQKLRGLDELS
jgi:hypothetical protein